MELNKYPLSFSKEFLDLYNSMDPTLMRLEGIAPEHLDVVSMSEKYFVKRPADMSIDDNSNVNESKSYGNYISEITKGWLKLLGYYYLYQEVNDIFGIEKAASLMESVWNGDLYFHDSTAIQVPYCWSYSTSFLLTKGNFWGQLRSFPPHRARSFIDQVKEVTIEVAQQIAGAVAISDLFVNYSYFIKKENIDVFDPKNRKEIENDFQTLVHTLNKKLRPSHQSPFTNVSIFDRPNLENLFSEIRFPDGSAPDLDLVEDIQRIFADWFSKGDPSTGLPYRFPVVTLNLHIDDKRTILDKKAFEYFSKINLEKGCFNIYISQGNKVASCCRLINDLDMAGVDSFGNGGISLGSHRVVTVNLARLGRLSGSLEELKTNVRAKLADSRDLLIAHRELLRKRIKQGFLKFFDYHIMDINRLFSTFGVNGIYECMEEIGTPMDTPEGIKNAHIILDVINKFAKECSTQTGNSFNIEQVPAESLAVKFAAKDAYLYGMDYPLYANQFIPLWVDCDIVERIRLDGEFSRSLTGGGISHLNIGEKLEAESQMQKLIEYSIKAGCEHFAVNYNFAKCRKDHISVAGPSLLCPICGEGIVDNYTRIIGYFTPVSAWNKGRRSEHGRRIFKKNGEVLKGSEKPIENSQGV